MVENTPLDKNEALKAYDAIAPLYQEYSSKKLAYLDAVDELVISKIKANSRLLDIGAGDGRRLKKIMKTVGLKDVVAIEPSTEMAKICREATGAPVHQVFAEDIDTLNLNQFDVVTALWNVFGHVQSSQARLKALKNIVSLLKPHGIVILDVNNRHNASSYGKFKVLCRRILDALNFKEARGDASYDWKIGENTFKSRGHLFTPAEIENLFREANLTISSRFSLDYNTGERSDSKYKGQLFYILDRN